MKTVQVGNLNISNRLPFILIAGPCQIEGRDHSLEIAGQISKTCKSLGLEFIFKSSFDKANRTSISGKRGIGMASGLEILSAVKEEIGCPVLTDVHEPGQCAEVARHVDILQIPAFLCRQTDLLLAAGKTNKPINLKKGQFLAPWDIQNAIGKIASTGNQNILICERGTSFGYNSLVTDMRSLPILAKTTYPVIIDATHSVQIPGGKHESSGGQREFAPVIARAGVAVGVAGVFLETHDDPDSAPSDGPNMIKLNDLESILCTLMELDRVAKLHPVEI
ncbi:MAG: 3-deoxy-8-phosphooctulonate synthase [Rhodobacteraceae bacterium]|nr:3-deoxy-8-phosphooctulonate synthase [Paracoccaceae bacterium]MDE2916380.1 3-deoxy-8-phosphooctulonate synthase [Paracoccaceae bacterium]MYG42835.1 3-deoxy-8-phosphooctulonate synthase [Paracoccaceae bacterium]